MAKIIDITNKLKMDENSQIKIGENIITIKDDTATVLQVLALSQKDDFSPKDFPEIIDLLVCEDDKSVITALSFSDFQIVVETIMNIIMGDVEDKGKNVTPAMI